MDYKVIIGVLLIGILLFGCTTQTIETQKYICTNGTQVNDPNLCLIQNNSVTQNESVIQTITQNNTLPEKNSSNTAIIVLLHMDETSNSNIIDSSSNQNNGIAFGTTIAPGKIGNSRSFNGISDYIQLTKGIGLLGSFVIEVWVKPVSTGNENGAILYNWGGLYPSDWELYKDPNNHVAFYMSEGDFDIHGNTVITSGNWHQITVKRDVSNLVEIYVDGRLDASGSTSQNLNFGFMQIGRAGPYTQYFSGQIDEIIISNNVTSNLSSTPIQTESITQNETQIEQCTNNWVCMSWSSCSSNGVQTRTCIDTNNCGVIVSKPEEITQCIPSCPYECCISGEYYSHKTCPSGYTCNDSICKTISSTPIQTTTQSNLDVSSVKSTIKKITGIDKLATGAKLDISIIDSNGAMRSFLLTKEASDWTTIESSNTGDISITILSYTAWTKLESSSDACLELKKQMDRGNIGGITTLSSTTLFYKGYCNIKNCISQDYLPEIAQCP